MVLASATLASILRCFQLSCAFAILPSIHHATMARTSAAATSAHHMKSSQMGLSMFLPAQYCVTNESHPQSLESGPMSLSRFTARFSQPAPSPDFGGAGDLAHAAALVVAHGLRDLLLRVHHERTVAGDGLGDRDAGEQEQTASGRGAAKAHSVALPEQRELPVANLLASVPDEHRALKYVRHRLLLARKRDGDIGARFDRPVLIDDRDVRVDHRTGTQRLAGDHAHARAPVLAQAFGNLARGNLLVARPRHLQFRRQVHPDLESVHSAAFVADVARGHFGMHDAGACGHPLHVARAKHAAMAGRVLVLELALQHVSDGLEAAMRVIGRTDRLAGAVISRPHLVEKEEGIDYVQSRGRHWPAHDEACAFALTVRGDDPGGFADGARARCHGFLLPKRRIWGRMVREQAPESPLGAAAGTIRGCQKVASRPCRRSVPGIYCMQ